jgi:hypothetical protein
MRKVCAQAVEKPWETCETEHNLCTVRGNHPTSGRVKTAISAREARTLYQRFPQAFSAVLALFFPTFPHFPQHL